MAVVKGGGGGRLRAAAMVAAAAVAVLTLMTNSINGCGAAVLLKSNVTYDHRYCFSAGNCLIAEDFDLDVEFLMDSHVARFLAGTGGGSGTAGSGIDNKPAEPCGHVNSGQQYCLSGGQTPQHNVNTYNRNSGGHTPPPHN